MWGHPFINFVYGVDLSVAYLFIFDEVLHLFAYSFIWVLWIFVLIRKELNVFEACVGSLSRLQENFKTDKKTKQKPRHAVRLCPFIYRVSKDKNVHVFCCNFAFHFADVVIYSGQFPLFVPVSNATSFLYRRCEAVSRT